MKVADGHKQQGKWILAPVDDITKPKKGRICYPPSWWRVTEDNEVLFYGRYSSPQCNTNKSIVERIGCGFDAPPTTIKFIEMTFHPHYCED